MNHHEILVSVIDISYFDIVSDFEFRISDFSKKIGCGMDSPTLSTILVNYCQWDDTARIIRQLRASDSLQRGESEIVLVDNHSPTHSILPELRRLEGVSVRRWSRNFGFARAVNEGVRLSRGQWLLLLNPDITIQDDIFTQIQSLTQTLPQDIGVVGLNVRNADGSPQLTAGPTPTFFSTLWRRLLPRVERKYYRRWNDTHRQSVDWISGCALLIRRNCFEQLQGMDSDFFLYYEDVDFCLRARRAGWQVIYEPGIRVTHHHPLASRQVSSWLHLLTRQALMTFARKHWPNWQASALCRLVQMETLAQRRSVFGKELYALANEMRHGHLLAVEQRLSRLARWENEQQHVLALQQTSPFGEHVAESLRDSVPIVSAR